MKLKAIAGIIVTLLLATAMFSAVPTSATPAPVIDVGVIGPVGWPQYGGMKEGAEIARDWINDPNFDPDHGSGPGIVIDGTRYEVQLHFGDEHASDMNEVAAAAEMNRLIDEGCKFIYGGFRTEMTSVIQEVAMDRHVIHSICGSATNELIDCGTGTCGACVRCDYARYKYAFRITPINNTMLGYNIIGFLKYYALPMMATMYGSPVNVAVLAEDLAWTAMLYGMFTAKYPNGTSIYLGPQANIVLSSCAKTAIVPTPVVNFVPYLDQMHTDEIRLIIIIYSQAVSVPLIAQWDAHPVKAVPLGIDVLGQEDAMWVNTGGGCEYEAFLASTGTRTPTSTISEPYTTQELYDKTVEIYGHAPIYTSWGVYDGIIALRETLERADADGCPVDTIIACADPSPLIPYFETTVRDGTLGRFKFTQFHDPYSVDFLHEWAPPQYVRAAWVQWQAGRREVTFPIYSDIATGKLLPYWKRFVFPPRMWPYPLDLTYDGLTDMRDIAMAAKAFGTYPGHPRYDHGAAVIAPPLDVVDMRDIAACARAFGTYWSPYPVPY